MQIKQLALIASVLPAVMAGVIPPITRREDLAIRQFNLAELIDKLGNQGRNALNGLLGGGNGQNGAGLGANLQLGASLGGQSGGSGGLNSGFGVSLGG
ncbi:hypothetical protein AAF712_016688, partial [Marasmius tenuissimus]